MPGLINITSQQSISIYGYKKPLRVLNWKSVADREDLTFKKLFGLGITEKQLQVIQPDKTIWINEKGLQLSHITLVPSWKIHVTRDMHASIVEIAMLNLTPQFLQHTGVTFSDLVDSGLTLNLMMILKLDLTTWIHLGLYRDFLKDLTDVQSIALFKLPKNMVLQCVLEKSSNQYKKEVVTEPVPGQIFKNIVPMQQVGSDITNPA
jgi:hypothetical protein